jgi:DNA polymerase-1
VATAPDPTNPLLLLVDGHSLAYRAFYAFAYSREGGLRTSTGIPTSVCFGFLKALLDVLDRYKPSHVAVAFDTRQPTFRHEADETYKAGRPETPPEFITDIENLQELLTALNIPLLMAPGFEADDVLGTLAIQAQSTLPVKILSGDQDLFQLIDKEEKIHVLHLNSKDRITEFGTEQVKEKLGIWPWQVVDYKALCGDSSDNIPGVKGIGQKRAVELLSQFKSLEDIYQQLSSIKGAMHKRLQEGQEAAQHSQFMARIQLDVPIPLDWDLMKLTGFDQEHLIPLLQKLEFHSMISKVEKLQIAFGGQPATPQDSHQTTASEDVEPVHLTNEEDALWFDFASIPTPTVPPVQIINTPEKLHQLVHTLEKHNGMIAWDTETTSLTPQDAQLVGVGCCWSFTEVAYIPICHSDGQCLPLEQVKQSLGKLWADPTSPKVMQNCKFDLAIFRAQGITVQGIDFDPMLASYVLDPEANHSLSDLAGQYLNLPMQSYKKLVGKNHSIAEISIPEVAKYCGADAYATLQLVPILKEKLQANPQLWNLYHQIELPLALVLEEMEWQGIRVDVDFLQQFSQQLQKELTELEQEAYTQAGEAFNLNSPKQLGTILFEKLGLSTQKTRKSKSGQYSTDAAVLEKLEGDHPVIDTITSYRTLSKLKSTYVDALPQLVRPDTGRVHTHFNQTVTATGRLSSSDPNLQNIPIRTEFSRRIRRAFIPKEGWLMVSADYSQIELRILAHLAQETTLIEGFNAGEDVHTLTAKLLLNKDEITSDERRLAKTINYGVIYGMGAQRFARAAGVSQAEARHFIQQFNHQYAHIFSYMRSTEEQVESLGYVETLLGRRRYFPQLRNLTGYRKQAELRAAVNAPIQGTASDIIKIAMVTLAQRLQGFASKLLLQVHDELVFEVDPQEWQDLEPLIRQAMEGAMTLSVPLTVDIRAGSNWMEAK